SFRGRMRNIESRMARGMLASGEANRKKSTKGVPKSPLYRAALATERTLWTAKLAQRPKSFWYPYPTLKNLKPLAQLLAASGLDLLKLCHGPMGRSRILELRMETSHFSLRRSASSWM